MKALLYYRLKSIANIINKLGPANTYTYDLYGRRIQKTVNGMVTNFLWDEDNISLELNENNQPIRRYVYGVGMDNVEGHFEYAEATSNPFATDKKGWYTYIKDQVGTIYKTFSHGTSQVVNSRAYDTFGNLISQSGTSKSPLGFQSKYLDPESGLYYFYHRYYSPSLGRFTTEDPIGLKGGLNMNAFVRHNPVNNIDYYGLVEGNDWQWMMPNGGGLDKITYHDFDVIWDHAGWFFQGVIKDLNFLFTTKTDDCKLKKCLEDCRSIMFSRPIYGSLYFIVIRCLDPYLDMPIPIAPTLDIGINIGCRVKCLLDQQR